LAVVWTVFTALGLGLALPFLALSLFPSLLRFLPRPGSWMVTLKEVLAFPLFASTVWLIWVFAQQTSLESVAVLLLVCVGLGAAGWAWQSGRLPKRVGVFTGAVLSLCSLIALFLTVAKTDRPLANAGQLKQTGKDAFTWIAFEPGLPEKLAAEGRTVFVDYTASWCLTCKVNERVVFGSQAVREKLAKEGHKLALVRADWTNEDAAIGYSLAQFGRSGVPLYLVYGPNAGGKPEVLPQILTPSLFLAALERAAASP
jgi:thiol:disulfide interchange protein DsbD